MRYSNAVVKPLNALYWHDTNVERKGLKKINANNNSIVSAKTKADDDTEELWWWEQKIKAKKKCINTYTYTCAAFGIGIYSSYTAAKSESKSESESSLCIKIDGITFDCLPLVEAPTHDEKEGKKKTPA